MRGHAEAVGDWLEILVLLVNAVLLPPPPRLVHERPVRRVHQADDAVVDVAGEVGDEIRSLVFFAEGGDAWREFDLAILARLGFDQRRSLEIARESYVAAYGEQKTPKSAMFAIKRLFNLVRVARIDAHEPTREALVRSGCIDDQTPIAQGSGD